MKIKSLTDPCALALFTMPLIEAKIDDVHEYLFL
jgi:hypothetical protein